MAGELFGGVLMLLWLAVLVSLIAVFVRSGSVRSRSRQRGNGDGTHGFPVNLPRSAIPLPNDGPGRYRVIGVISATGADTKMYIDAETLANAKVKAELRGVIVTDILKEC